MIKEGDFVMGMTSEGVMHGVVEHIMVEGGTLGTPGSEYALESMPPESITRERFLPLLILRSVSLTPITYQLLCYV